MAVSQKRKMIQNVFGPYALAVEELDGSERKGGLQGIAVVSPESRFARRRSPGLQSIRPMTYNTLPHGEHNTSPRCYFS